MDKVTAVLMMLGLSEFESMAIIRLFFSALLGGLIGVEREYKGRPAGLKTFSLVCMGASLAMLTNEYMYLYLAGSTGDTARMAAQVISGIGFLGAGTIMVTGKNQIKGLTTAAALWVTASIGIAIGSGFITGAFVALIFLYLFSAVFSRIDRNIAKKSRVVFLYIEASDKEFISQMIRYFYGNGIRMISFSNKNENQMMLQDISATVELSLPRGLKRTTVVEYLRGLDGAIYIQEL